MLKLNERLAALRKQSNLTQQQLADMLNVSNKTISQWETGRALPDITMLLRLAEIYQMNLNELLMQNSEQSILDESLIKTLLSDNYKDKLLIVYGLQLCGLILFYGIYFYLHYFSIPYAIKLVFDCISCLVAFHVYRSSQRYQINKSTLYLNLFNSCCFLLATQILTVPCSSEFLHLFINDPYVYLYSNLYLKFSHYIQIIPLLLTFIAGVLLLLHTLRVIFTYHTLNHRIVKLLLSFILIVGVSNGLFSKIIYRMETQTFTTLPRYYNFKQKYEWLIYVHNLSTADLSSINPEAMDKAIGSDERLMEYRGIVGFDDDKLCVYKVDSETKRSTYQPFLYAVYLICDSISMILLLRFQRQEQL